MPPSTAGGMAVTQRAAQHRGLARSGGRRPQRVYGVRGVPEVGQHVHAARLELGGLGILVLVDHVLVESERHDLSDLGLDPRLAERGEVLSRVAVQHELVDDDLADVLRLVLMVVHPILGQRDREVIRREDVVVEICTDAVAIMEHRAPLSRSSSCARIKAPSDPHLDVLGSGRQPPG